MFSSESFKKDALNRMPIQAALCRMLQAEYLTPTNLLYSVRSYHKTEYNTQHSKNVILSITTLSRTALNVG